MENLPCTATLLLLFLATGPACSSSYRPRPGPRVAIVQENGNLAFVKGNRTHALGVFGGGLIDAVEDQPAAKEHAEIFRNRNIAGFTMVLGGTLGSLSASTVALVNTVGATEDRSKTAGIVGATVAVAGLGLVFAGLGVLMTAPPHFWDAVNIYNDSVSAYPAAFPPPTMWPVPRLPTHPPTPSTPPPAPAAPPPASSAAPPVPASVSAWPRALATQR